MENPRKKMPSKKHIQQKIRDIEQQILKLKGMFFKHYLEKVDSQEKKDVSLPLNESSGDTKIGRGRYLQGMKTAEMETHPDNIEIKKETLEWIEEQLEMFIDEYEDNSYELKRVRRVVRELLGWETERRAGR